jgi:hypothetical protein
MDTGEEKIEDQALVQQLRRQADKVKKEAVGVAVVFTLAALLIPVKADRSR